MGTINARKDQKTSKMASRAANLTPFVNRIRDEKDLVAKKQIAYEMAEQFEVGGKENFILSIQTAASASVVDRIAYNALLKGEGLSSKI